VRAAHLCKRFKIRTADQIIAGGGGRAAQSLQKGLLPLRAQVFVGRDAEGSLHCAQFRDPALERRVASQATG
jgi:hypothetical protein